MTAHQPNVKASKIKGGVHTDQRHDSAHKHVTGEAIYIDDMPEPAGLLNCNAWQDCRHRFIGSACCARSG